MAIASLSFLVEFLLFFLGYLLLARASLNLANIALLAGSLAYLAQASPSSLPWLLGSIAANYALLRCLGRTQDPGALKRLLVAGVGGNVALLAGLKYAGLFFSGHAITLPMGVSYYTFALISLLVDSYRNPGLPCTAREYTLFGAFLPHMVAGPILRHREFLDSLRQKTRRITPEHVRIGLLFVSFGMAKKRLLADTLAPHVDALYAHAQQLTTLEAWSAALLYTLQIYYDFSGYSDMVYGLAAALGLSIPLNFNSPYKAESLSDFWRRWHISLMLFIRDYVYIPLGGSRCGNARRFGNLMLSMLITGIWHGSGLTFVAWGLLHGCGLVASHGMKIAGLGVPRVVARGTVFFYVLLLWVVFRAASLRDAGAIFRRMFLVDGFTAPAQWKPALDALHLRAAFTEAPPVLADAHLVLPLALVFTAWAMFAPNTQTVALEFRPSLAITIIAALAMFAALLSGQSTTPFLYSYF